MEDRVREWLKTAHTDSDAVIARSNQGIVLRYTDKMQDMAIKVANGRGLAGWFQRAMLKREYRAYRYLAGVPGLPHCHGLLDNRCLLLDYIDGTLFRDAVIADRERFFEQLLEIILTCHTRGVAHGDLKRKANLMADSAGQPVVIDLGAAICRKPGWRPFNHWLFNLIRQTDLNAWVKLKHNGYDNVPEQDLRYLRRSRLEHWIACIRNFRRSDGTDLKKSATREGEPRS